MPFLVDYLRKKCFYSDKKIYILNHVYNPSLNIIILLMNLQDELIRTDQRRQQTCARDYSITDLKTVLQQDVATEKATLSSMGLSANVLATQKHTWLEQYQLNEHYQGEVFYLDDVRKVCMDYGMRMLPAHLYRGPLDPMFGPKVKNFQRQHQLSDEEVEENFFIMAPPEAFELEKRQRPVLDLDPVLLYKVNDHFFKLVHQWGSDLSVFRYVSSWKNRDLWNMTVHWFLMTFMVTMLLLGFFVDGLGNAVTLSLLISGLIGWMYYSSFRDSPDEMRHRFTRYNWNQTWTY